MRPRPAVLQAATLMYLSVAYWNTRLLVYLMEYTSEQAGAVCDSICMSYTCMLVYAVCSFMYMHACTYECVHVFTTNSLKVKTKFMLQIEYLYILNNAWESCVRNYSECLNVATVIIQYTTVAVCENTPVWSEGVLWLHSTPNRVVWYSLITSYAWCMYIRTSYEV